MDTQSNLAEQYYRDSFFENPWQDLEQTASNLANFSFDIQAVMAHYSDAFFEDPWKDLLESSSNVHTEPNQKFNPAKQNSQNKRGKFNKFQRGRGNFKRGNWQKK